MARSGVPHPSAWRSAAKVSPANQPKEEAMVKPIPEGFHSVTPHLAIDGAAAAIDFYKKAFGAVELGRMPAQDGKRLMHAMIRIGDSMVMLADAFPEYGGQ